MNMEIDSLTHLSFSPLEEVQSLLKNHADRRFVMAGYDLQDARTQLEIMDQLEGSSQLDSAFGCHPWCVVEREEQAIESILRQYQEFWQTHHKAFSFIGEIGLDTFSQERKKQKALQLRVFKYWLSQARDLDRPVILHIVSAHGEALEALKPFAPLKGFVHGFSGSSELAESYIRLGLQISVGSALLNPGFRKVNQVIENIKYFDNLLIETDQPHSRSEGDAYNPRVWSQVAEKLASSLGISLQQVIDKTSQNFLKMVSS